MNYLTPSFSYGLCPLVKIECFHSRGQHICKFIGTKESVCIRKEFNSQRTGLGHQNAAVSLFWDTNMAAVTSCENTPLLLPFSWIEKGGLFLNVALFMGPQSSEQNQSMANNEKAFMW